MRYHIITFGCQMNEADSDRIAADLEKRGYKPVISEEAKKQKASSLPSPRSQYWERVSVADLIVVNMCSVRQPAVDRVYGLANKFKGLKIKNKKLRTILTGCILKRDLKNFRERFDSIQRKEDILSCLPTYKEAALIPISNGCNNFCSYCVVPYARGRLICRNQKEIVKEVKRTIKNGAKEIWLLGQNVNDYKSPDNQKINFAKLFSLVDKIPGQFKIYFMSPHPKNFSDELIKTLARSKHFSRYLNLPVQSGNDQILKKMYRPYTAKQYKELVKRIRKAMPDINLSTDVIVGFPGETKSQFKDTEKLFRTIKFNIAYINKYSPRTGTTAFKLKNDVPLDEKKRRERILLGLIKTQ